MSWVLVGRTNVLALPKDTMSDLHVLGVNLNALGIDCTEVSSILKPADLVRL